MYKKSIFLIPILVFIIMIIIGWILLMFPVCNNGNVVVLDSLFSAVSASSINGMSTVNISKHYTFLGQFIIIILTQIGAIGVITFLSLILNLKGKKLRLSETILLNNELKNNDYKKITKRLKEVIKYTLSIELIGAFFLAVILIPKLGFKNGIWYSIFHSITAFCNAGFDLFGSNSLVEFANNSYINFVLIMLMLLGGIGFFVIEDLIDCIKNKTLIHMKFQTKIVLVTTFIIYLLSVIMLKIAQPELTMKQVLFISASSRTTGFTTADLSNTNSLTKLIISTLMMIGGAPGSTSGGIRITSISIIVLITISTIKEKKEIICFYKKIDTELIKQAVTNIFICNSIVILGIFLFAIIQKIELINIVFMCVSAFSATGLSVLNVAQLTLSAKIILMLLMFIGRIGPISIVSIFILNKKENNNIEYVTGKLMI